MTAGVRADWVLSYCSELVHSGVSGGDWIFAKTASGDYVGFCRRCAGWRLWGGAIGLNESADNALARTISNDLTDGCRCDAVRPSSGAESEREACARLVQQMAGCVAHVADTQRWVGVDIPAAIRARGKAGL